MDAAILIDTNTPDQLGKIGEKILHGEIPIIVIDHHHPHPDTTKIASLMIVDESAAAAAEVVYQLFRASKTEPGMAEARALLAARPFDPHREEARRGWRRSSYSSRVIGSWAGTGYLENLC